MLSRYFGILLMITIIVSCHSAPLTTGYVLEGEDPIHKPIPGAFVFDTWHKIYGGIGHGGGSVCVHVESSVTDELGRYQIPRWRGKSTSVMVYKPGYELSLMYKKGQVIYDKKLGTYIASLIDKPGEKFEFTDYQQAADFAGLNNRYLRPTILNSEERLNYLLRPVLSSSLCGAKDGSDKNLIPMLKALYAEAQSLAQTVEGRKKAEYILYHIENLELGTDVAEKRRQERLVK